MVLVKILSAAIPPLIKGGIRAFSKYESKVYTGLYGRSAGRGVRHGLAAGGVVGSLISNQDDGLNDGKISKTNVRTSSNKPNQARNRYVRNSNRCKPVQFKYRKYNRYSRSR